MKNISPMALDSFMVSRGSEGRNLSDLGTGMCNPPGVLSLRGDGYVRAKNRKWTLRKTKILIFFGPLEKLSPKFWSILPKFRLRFSKFFDFHQFLVENSGNCDPLREKFSNLVILGPFQRLIYEFVPL